MNSKKIDINVERRSSKLQGPYTSIVLSHKG